ncbi:hypothetical protein TSUD_228190 [Trifolium subterraneum]|uniref:Uncharacterized protein n=1 Tax=Trifolium subterraneum TaxID=3900 RepID=A0A2Z6LLM7_TRISU|nr:hypothetical protein TSUD_228190 [Trifolium subterraneum]
MPAKHNRKVVNLLCKLLCKSFIFIIFYIFNNKEVVIEELVDKLNSKHGVVLAALLCRVSVLFSLSVISAFCRMGNPELSMWFFDNVTRVWVCGNIEGKVLVEVFRKMREMVEKAKMIKEGT